MKRARKHMVMLSQNVCTTILYQSARCAFTRSISGVIFTLYLSVIRKITNKLHVHVCIDISLYIILPDLTKSEQKTNGERFMKAQLVRTEWSGDCKCSIQDKMCRCEFDPVNFDFIIVKRILAVLIFFRGLPISFVCGRYCGNAL